MNDYVIIESGEEEKEKWQGQVRRRTDALETLGRDKLRARERLTFRIIRTDQGKEKWQALRAMASSVGTEDG